MLSVKFMHHRLKLIQKCPTQTNHTLRYVVENATQTAQCVPNETVLKTDQFQGTVKFGDNI